MITANAIATKAFPMLGDEHLIDDFPGEESLSHTRRRQGRFAGYRLIIGADCGPRKAWIVWALAGRFSVEHEHDGFIVLNQLNIDGGDIALHARLIADFHEASDYPKASGVFVGPKSISSNSLLAVELDKEELCHRLSLPSEVSPSGRCCIRCEHRKMGDGWEVIAGLLHPPAGEPRLLFCPAAYPTYRALMAQMTREDEHHAVVALRYAVMGWRQLGGGRGGLR